MSPQGRQHKKQQTYFFLHAAKLRRRRQKSEEKAVFLPIIYNKTAEPALFKRV
jgi:hypothetical protein